MRIITSQDIERLNINNYEFYYWVNEMIKNKNRAYLPAKISMKQPEHIFYNIMPCILTDYNVAGIKVVNRYPTRYPSIQADLLLYDYNTGQLKALMDATYITKMRTGAVAAHSILLFARENYQSIGLIGLGNVMQATMDIFLELVTEKQLKIKLYNYKDHAKKFINRYKKYTNLEFIICNSYEETIADSDIIISGVTFADENFCDDSCYKEGCLVVPIHTLGFQNCDLFFDKVYGDDYNHICEFKYFDKFKQFNEICDVVNGIQKGRENNKERILIYNIGIAMHDIYFAHKIFNLINS